MVNVLDTVQPSVWAGVEWGLVLAYLGAGLASLMPGIGSALAVSRVGRAAVGAVVEEPSVFSKVLVLQALPGTQGIYGLLIAFLVLLNLNVLGGDLVVPTVSQGMMIFFGSLPIAIVGLFSALWQGAVAVSGVALVARRSEESGKAITLTVMVETFAILALLVSFLMVFFLKLG